MALVKGHCLFKYSLLLILVIFAKDAISAEHLIYVDHKAEQIKLEQHLEVLRDSSQALDLTQVINRADWQKLETSAPFFGITQDAVWIRFSLTNESPSPLPLYFHIRFSLLDEVDFFVMEDEKLVDHFRSGESVPFSTRPLDHYGLLFPIIAKQGVTTDLYLKAKNKGSMELPVTLWTQTAFLKEQLSVLLIWGGMFSIFLVMSFYNGILYISTQDAEFGVFSLFCISIFAYFFTLQGFSFQYLWPNSSAWQIASPLVFIGTSTALFDLLIYYLLRLKKIPIAGKTFMVLAGLNVATILLLPVLEFALVMRIQILLIINSAIAAIIMGAYCWKQQNNPERFAFSGLLACAVFAVYTTLGKLTIVNVTYLTDNGVAATVTLTTLLFSLTLADRFQRLEKEKKTIQEKSILYLERYKKLFESVSEGVFILDRYGALLSANPSLCQMFNCSSFEELKLYIEKKEKIHELPLYQSFVKTVCENQRLTDLILEVPVSKDKNSWVNINSHINIISEHDWQVEGTIFDITERRANQMQLEYMATHDSLTHLLNRRAFEHELKSVLKLSNTRKSTNALIYLDLDQFKVVNDVYGHSIGDEFLRRLANTLQATLNSEQVLARLGGDEFGIVSTNTSQQQAELLAQRLIDCVQNFTFHLKDTKLNVGASIGLVVFEDNFHNIEVLLSRADAACYLAKDLGRNRMHVYSSIDDEFKQRQVDMSWVSVIREALEKSHFQLYFQKITAINRQEYGDSYEVLLRLKYNDVIVPPFDFLPAAEKYGLMTQVDRWVVSNFFTFLQSHPDDLSNLSKASINLSVQSISDASFRGFLKEAFEQHAIPHNKICFEITETTAISSLEKTISFINEYRSNGCEFAIDDFGTGFSSFAYLKQLPADYLKIDGLFVKNILNSAVDRAMVASICEVASKLGIRTVAEFVESKAVSDQLKTLGVDYAQGFFYDRPSPIDPSSTDVVEASREHEPIAGRPPV